MSLRPGQAKGPSLFLPSRNALGITATGGAKYQTGQSYIGLVGTRTYVPTEEYAAGKYDMARTIHEARSDITSIGVAFANWYASIYNTENPHYTSFTITASIEYPLGVTVTRLTFNGSNTGTCQDWQTISSDLVTIPGGIPSGAQFAVRAFRVFTGGGGILFCDAVSKPAWYAGGDSYQYATVPLTDLTGVTGTFPSSNGPTPPNFVAFPLAIFGPTSSPSYAIVGDSRQNGQESSVVTTGLYHGESEKTIATKRAYINVARAGTQVQVALGNFSHRAAIIRKFCTHVLIAYGVNDVYYGSRNAIQVSADLTTLLGYFPYKWVQGLTISSGTTSTDNWTTLANQTVYAIGAGTGSIDFLNSLIREGFFFDKYFDVQSVVQNQPLSGVFNPGYTTDGVHLNSVGTDAILSSGIIIPD